MPDVTTESETQGGGLTQAPRKDYLSDPLGTADKGFSGPSSTLPHLDTIQSSFGKHDVSGVETFTGASAVEANRSLGTEGMAKDGQVSLKDTSLHTAAHEAAHTLQQRSGIQLDGGVGSSGDRWEQHADAVADKVTAGESAEPLLDQLGHIGTTGGGLQFLDTWDAEEGKWVSAEDEEVLTKNADTGIMADHRRFNLFGMDIDTGSIGDGKRTVQQLATIAPDSGDLEAADGDDDRIDELWEQARADRMNEVKSINPKSSVPKNIIKTATDSNWNKAKEFFASGSPPSTVNVLAFAGAPVMKAIMWKLWEYRQWHHDRMLQKTKAALGKNGDGEWMLDWWAAAGSVSLTSDIDVNLKGAGTEEAAKEFNRRFKAEYGKEAGTVYDVNVYALDFMHGKGTMDGHTRRQDQEGKRKGFATGGIGDSDKAMQDLQNQEEWSLVKMRLYMTPTEWEAYKTDSDPDGTNAAIFRRAEIKYRGYRRKLRVAMDKVSGSSVLVEDDDSITGAQQVETQALDLGDHKSMDHEDIMIAGSNRVYEEKLAVVALKRTRLKKLITRYDKLVNDEGVPLKKKSGETVEKLKERIDNALLELRELISEAALYSNEAYVTDGAVNHTVVGLQMKKPIVMKKGAMFHAVTENMADTLKEIGRHGGTLGEAAYKSGKYIWRLADAIQNLGMDLGGLTGDVTGMLTVGKTIATTIKAGKHPNPMGRSKEMLSADVVNTEWGGVTSPDGLKALVTRVGTQASAKFNQQIRSQDKSDEDALPVMP